MDFLKLSYWGKPIGLEWSMRIFVSYTFPSETMLLFWAHILRTTVETLQDGMTVHIRGHARADPSVSTADLATVLFPESWLIAPTT